MMSRDSRYTTMRRTLFISIAALHLIGVAASAAGDSPDRIAATFVIDTRWSCGDDMPEFRTLVRQGLGATEPQDYIEILTAHAGRPRIRLAQTTYGGVLDHVAAANRILGDIREGFLAGADVSNALKMALDRLESTCSKQGYRKALVIILTDGHLEDSDAAGVLKLAEEFRKRNWPLYVTGDNNTNRNLLVGANRGKIRWSSIAEANPSLWLQQARASLSKPQDGIGQQSEEQRTRSAPDLTTKPSPFGESPVRMIPQPPRIPEQSASKLPQDGITAKSRTEMEVTFPGGRLPAPGLGPATPSTEKGGSVAPNTPEDVNRPPEKVKSAKDDKKKAGSAPKQPLWASVKRLFGHIWPWLVGGICAVPLTIAGYVFVSGKSKAERIRRRLQGYLKAKKSNNDGMLVATLNGQTRRLGRLSRLRTVYVGSGARNTLRVTEKGVSDRHLCLYQKAGRLMVQNLSRNPVTVNGLQLEPKGKRALALPSGVELTPSIKLSLFLQQFTDSTAGSKSNAHDQNGQQ